MQDEAGPGPAAARPRGILHECWLLLRATVEGYIEDEAMTRGAAIAFYAFFSAAPLLVIAIAIAGAVFGEQAAEGAVAEQLRELMGDVGAEAVQGLVRSAADRESGRLFAYIGLLVLLVLASGVFSEVQAALNAIWRAPPHPRGTIVQVAINKALSFALVLLTGVLLLVSLLATTVLSLVTTWAVALLPETARVLGYANVLLTFVLGTILFATIYKVLPNRRLHWSDVGIGAAVTAVLFTIGKVLIGWYIGSTQVASSFGAAGALMVVLLWTYYSAQIFLLGAEFTRAWAGLHPHTGKG
ncbi:MAG: YihY/virulence factor BrkB family protein [Acetobacteraceae bacterium]|nr:YihY/virulence factor BrkB family protein [Acetobacteraceae bacterium]